MPLYDFRCEACGEAFEEMVPVGALAPCPECGSEATKREFSPPAIAGRRLQVTGSEAARSESQRREREAGRSERLSEAKKARARGETPRGPRSKKQPPGFWA